ncbi:hypothetical protein [Fusobacterium necrophorum]|uniref:hypothetical protein n=1 Tax=Fusobacterium necrophorum TaxID=859 RepID=UPI000460E5E2|nr:hypothetical protein [Fusobacterium necrophorum]KDE62713.1 osmolarity sensor protein EnvZ [Fusobacterium necrophorum BFTR-1]MBR8734960.1 hypothetical protein [Fusobacterium necrophorum]MBR8791132.1 hypothetical protein [Fusobacterium necrophorum]MDK4501675.1 osmolarity sensor protein EnvZ [Fusobacterium necrophorum]
MSLSVVVYKEKKEKDFRMVIIPSGQHKIGVTQRKDYGIVSYLNKNNVEKIGEFVLWALQESDEKMIENSAEVDWGKQYFNCGSRRVAIEYNLIDFEYYKEEYILILLMKDGYGYSPFKDGDGNGCRYVFKEKPTALELGRKIMEMFDFKENYDR